MVHILPGYPKTSPDDPLITLIAFYLQLPKGFSNATVNKNVLVDIVKSDTPSIEGSLSGTIVTVKSLQSKEHVDDDDSDRDSIPTGAMIGASLGGALFLVVAVALLLRCKSITCNR